MPTELVNEEARDIFNADCVAVYPQHPFQNIALTFSGGGFRAASFSLGLLSYLHRMYFKHQDDTLLHHVRFITSTSGGSITNGFYAISVFSESDFKFERFYNQLRTVMDGETLLTTVFDILNDEKQWTEKGILKKDGKEWEVRKQRNAINAFAKAYDKILFKGKTLDCIYSCGHDAHLEEICFNTTEFNNGLNFYFQVNGKTPGISKRGNGYLQFRDHNLIRHLKVSDLVAASSCFPGGFEPIVFPNDFVHEGLQDVNAVLNGMDFDHNNPLERDMIRNQPFNLMDGGIVDNMGIHNVMLEDAERMGKGKGQFDLILACDVTSYFNKPLEAVHTKMSGSLFSIATLIGIFKISGILFLLCLASIYWKVWPVAGYLFLLPFLSLSIIYFIGRSWIRKKKDSEDGSVVRMVLNHIDYFLKLPFPVLKSMLKARWKSSVMLISGLFLKQIRRGQYENLFSKPRLVHRAISCLLHEFTTAHAATRLRILETKDKAWWDAVKDQLMPSEKMKQIANEAHNMGTTLWFDETDMHEQMKNKLIATGQFTVCYNLIKHICRVELLDTSYQRDNNLQELKSRLLKDFKCFQSDPLFMLNNLQATLE